MAIAALAAAGVACDGAMGVSTNVVDRRVGSAASQSLQEWMLKFAFMNMTEVGCNIVEDRC